LCTFLRRLTPLASNISRIIHQLFLITTAFSVESIQRRTIKSQNSRLSQLNQFSDVQSNHRIPNAERMGAAWARHAICETALREPGHLSQCRD